MTKLRRPLAVIAATVLSAGCATQQKMLQEKQPVAIESALARGRFDLNCPGATGTVLSSDYIAPAVQGPWVYGMQRTEYTIGVEGCGQRRVYVVLCQVGTATCFAAHPEDQFSGRR